MSLPLLTDFYTTLSSGLTQIVSQIGSKTANELEFRLLGEPTRLQFKNIIEKLQRLHYNVKETDTLDISLPDDKPGVRVSISGLINIRKFCINGRISDTEADSEKRSYQRKERITKPHDLKDYNLRIGLAQETGIDNASEINTINGLIESSKIKKLFRYKHRYSFSSYDEKSVSRFDLTLIKSADGLTFKESNVLRTPEKYECEVEYLGPPINSSTNIEMIAKSLRDDLYNLLKWSQESFAVITNSDVDEIRNEYLQLAFPKVTYKPDDPRDFFVSKDVLPLEMHHIDEDVHGKYYIQEGFSVTEKADGLHYMLYISKKGSIYLINNRLEIKHSGLRSQDANSFGCLFDGELVRLRTDPTMCRFLLFDCFFWNVDGKVVDIRSKPLAVEGYEDDATKIDQITCRYQALLKFVSLNPVAISNNIQIEIHAKNYKFCFDPKEESIFTLVESIYNPANNEEMYDYDLDGVIFTPFEISYPKESSWPSDKLLLKWKPQDQLSIDFLVEIVNKGAIKRDNDIHGIQWKYKEAHLKVAKNKKNVDFIPYSVGQQKSINDLHVIRLKLENDGEIRALDKNIIFSESVVEFIYDSKKPFGYQWVPIRFRADKTVNKTPNGYGTANNTWSLINNPVSYNDIIHKSSGDHTGDQYYSQTSATLTELTKSMRDYNNRVKRLLFTTISKKLTNESKTGISLLELGSGRAGDLYKWKESRISYVLAVENDLGNLKDGITRWKLLQNEGTHFPRKIDFICGDCSKNLNSGDAGFDLEYRKALREILDSRGLYSFEMISCQFALHYFCETQKSIEEFFNNVSMNLKLGGYFFGTTIDGSRLFDKLKDIADLEGFAQKGNQKFRIWQIIKDYNETTLANVGQQVSVLNVSIGKKPIPEYLVNFTNLIKTAEKFGLKPAEVGDFKDLLAIQSFGDLYQIVKENPKYTKMSEDEKIYSFFNNIFIFKKVTNVTPEIKPEPIITAKKIKLTAVLKPTDNTIAPSPSTSDKPKPKVAFALKLTTDQPTTQSTTETTTKKIALKPSIKPFGLKTTKGL
jgi:hypothetical protein